MTGELGVNHHPSHLPPQSSPQLTPPPKGGGLTGGLGKGAKTIKQTIMTECGKTDGIGGKNMTEFYDWNFESLPPVGAVVNVRGQDYELIGHEPKPGLWRSTCVCGASFAFLAGPKRRHVLRTCPDHRGSMPKAQIAPDRRRKASAVVETA